MIRKFLALGLLSPAVLIFPTGLRSSAAAWMVVKEISKGSLQRLDQTSSPYVIPRRQQARYREQPHRTCTGPGGMRIQKRRKASGHSDKTFRCSVKSSLRTNASSTSAPT